MRLRNIPLHLGIQMKSMGSAWQARYGHTFFIAAVVLAARTTFATPIPPATFTFDVAQSWTLLPGCSPFKGSPSGGTCGSETSGPGYAATSGGIGTPSFLPLTPGGTDLGPGTAVDASSDWSSGSKVYSAAILTNSIQATGPASVAFIPIDVLSTGMTSVAGNGYSALSLVIKDQGTDLVDLTAHCAGGTCVSDWGTPGNLLTDMLCVANGDNYTITIKALTSAGKGSGGKSSTASAVLDPVIKLDPPSPATCPVGVPLSELAIHTSPGTSTGTGVPEPSPLILAAAGALGLGLLSRGRRRCGRVQ
jgi:hypothetical protein